MATTFTAPARPASRSAVFAVPVLATWLVGSGLWLFVWKSAPQNDLAYAIGPVAVSLLATAVVSIAGLSAFGRVSWHTVVLAQFTLLAFACGFGAYASHFASSPLLGAMILAAGVGANTGLRFYKDTNHTVAG